MRELIIFLCLAFAQTERLGHNYGQSGSHNVFESRIRNRISSVSTPPATYSNNNRQRTELNNGRGVYSTDSAHSGNFGGPLLTNYNKQFYTYSAPEDDVKDIENSEHLGLATHKNLRVVFIKAPENNAVTNLALQLAQKNAESKTAIYVLTKQTDIAELVNQLQNIQHSQESKPEVHFVKYRHPEDAIRAQQIIQNEYDALGGSSRVSNEGFAPVLDFSSKKDELLANNNVNNVGPMNNVALMLNSFLPPKSRQ